MPMSREEAQAYSERLIKDVSEECERTGTSIARLSRMSGVDQKTLYYWINGLRVYQAYWAIVSMEQALKELKALPDGAVRKAVKDILK